MYQMRIALKQPLALPQRLAHLANVSVLEVAQASVNDAGRTAGCARGEIVLLDQQRSPPSARAFPRDGNTVNSATNHDHVEMLAL